MTYKPTFSVFFSFMVALGLFSQVAFSAPLTGMVRVDGSSTVYPITAAAAEEFGLVKENKNVRVTVAYSGTGGGFKKFCQGEVDINDASRPIKQKEIDCAKKNGISYLEIPVAFDGLSVVASTSNKFLNELTLAQLKEIWKPESNIKTWNQVNPAWPNEEVKLYGPGADSGTFDYFTETVVGKARASRSDYVASEDDNVLVKGVAASPYALGYFGYAYFKENQNKLKVIKVSNDGQALAPTDETIENGTYALSRPIFIYVSSKAVVRPEVQAFVRYYLKTAKALVPQVGYTTLPEAAYAKATQDFDQFVSSHTKAAAE